MDTAKVVALVIVGVATITYWLRVIAVRNNRLRTQDALRNAAYAMEKVQEYQKSAERLAERIADHRRNDSGFRVFYENQMQLRELNMLSPAPSQEMRNAMNVVRDRYPHIPARKYHAATNIALRNIEMWLDKHYPEEKEE